MSKEKETNKNHNPSNKDSQQNKSSRITGARENVGNSADTKTKQDDKEN